MKYEVKITLTESLLGTVPKNPEVYTQFIETKKPKSIDENESETVEETEARGWTGFHMDKQEGVFLYDYQIKGMLKELALIAFAKAGDDPISGMASKIERFVYVFPRRVFLGLDGPDGYTERPLRAQTPKGPRVTVTRSDYVDAGRSIFFELHVLPGPVHLSHIKKVLALGVYKGLGQWRSGSHGRFTVTSIKELNGAVAK